MNFSEYQRLASRTINFRVARNTRLANWVIGLAGETGEVAEPLKKHLFHDKYLDIPALSKELGDVLWYLTALATDHGLKLEDIAKSNIDKLAMRHLGQREVKDEDDGS